MRSTLGSRTAAVGSTFRRYTNVALVAWVLGWTGYLVAMAGTPGGPALPATSCLAVSCGAGLIALVVGIWMWRRTDPCTARWTGARIGMLSRTVGAAGVRVACTYHDPAHLLVGHGLALVLLALSGAAVAQRFLRP